MGASGRRGFPVRPALGTYGSAWAGQLRLILFVLESGAETGDYSRGDYGFLYCSLAVAHHTPCSGMGSVKEVMRYEKVSQIEWSDYRTQTSPIIIIDEHLPMI